MATGETELILRVDLEADPITGSLGSAHGASRRFAGWIGLAATLESIRVELQRDRDRDRVAGGSGDGAPPAG